MKLILFNKDNLILNFLALFLISIVLYKIWFNISVYDYYYVIFWFCNISALLLGISILLKFKPIIGAVSISVVPAQFLWVIDFILFYFFGFGFGRTSDLADYSMFEFYLSVLFHLILIPISIYTVYKFGLSRKSYLYSVIIFITLLLPLTYFITPESYNINCVFYQCDLSYEDYFYSDKNLYEGTIIYLILNMFFWYFIALLAYFVYFFYFKKFIKFVD
ncbi:MAG: hypothetical protein LAT82_00360 [Nanoarchaeota archaeon]|nr:hypothetical protein [Nanoarchaeota archaeon]